MHGIHSSVFWLPLLLNRDSVKLTVKVPQSGWKVKPCRPKHPATRQRLFEKGRKRWKIKFSKRRC